VFGKGDNRDDAIKAFEKALLLNGMAVVPSGPNEVKLIAVDSGRNIRVEGGKILMDESDLPDDDSVVTFVMPMQFIKPDEVQRIFQQHFVNLHAYGAVTPVPNAAALIVTENASVIRNMLKIKERIDKPSSSISTRWVEVRFADVVSLAETLEKLVKAEKDTKKAGTQIQVPSAPRGDAAAGGAAALNAAGAGLAAGEDSAVQIVPDARTNRILILGRPIDILFLENLIVEFDIPTDNRNALRRKLQYLSVVDFLPIAQQALERIAGLNDKQGSGQQAGGSTAQSSRNSRSSSSTANNNTNTNRNSSSGRSSGNGSSADILQEPDSSGVPESIIVGRTLLVADTITNSVIVQGPPQAIETVSQLLNEIDVRAPQVMISTVFGQFRREEGKDVGFNWVSTYQSGSGAGNAAQIGKPNLGTTGTDVNGNISDLNNIGAFPALVGGAFYGTFGDHLNVVVTAAQNTGKFTVLSRPSVYTTNNTKAVISSGQRVAVPTSSLTDFTGANNNVASNTNIEYRDVVLKLEVIPLVNSAKEVTLKIAQLNDQISGTQTISGVGEVPVISTQEINTTVTVPNNGTVVIGGLITKEKTTTESGVPILSDIPLLGNLFTSTSDKVEEKEIVIFLQPSIVTDDKSALDTQVRERSRYEVTPDVIKFAEPTSEQIDPELPSDLRAILQKESSRSATKGKKSSK